MAAARRYVAVVGAGQCPPALADAAERVGRALAERGAVLICGGLGGVMEAACRGAKSAGGTTIGFLPTPDRSRANPFVDFALPTPLGEGRNVLVVAAADAVIAVGGEFGTLSEIALALKTGKPVVGLATWELGKAGQTVDAIVAAATPEQAVEAALSAGADEHRQAPTSTDPHEGPAE